MANLGSKLKFWKWAAIILLILLIIGVVILIVNLKAEDSSQLANPASVFCENNGGTIQIITAADGSQSGTCNLPDGRVCDEWAFYNGNC